MAKEAINPTLKMSQEQLSKALNLVGRVIPSKSTLPVLTNVMIDAREGTRVKFVGTDMDMTVIAYAENIISDGSFCYTLPGVKFQETVSMLMGDVTLSLKGSGATGGVGIKANGYSGNLMGIEGDEYPGSPDYTDAPRIQLDFDILKSLINNVVFAAANEDVARPYLTCVSIAIRGNTISAFAADANRVAFQKFDLGYDAGEYSLLVPVHSLRELSRLMGIVRGSVAVLIFGGDERMIVDFGNVRFYAQLFAEKYPDLSTFFARKYPIKATIDRNTLLYACRQVSIVAKENVNIGVFNFTHGEDGDKLVIKASASGTGDVEVSVDVKLDGKEIILGLDIKSFMDVLSVIKTDSIEFSMDALNLPTKTVAAGTDDGFAYIQMPMHNEDVKAAVANAK